MEAQKIVSGKYFGVLICVFLTSCSFFHVPNVPILHSYAGKTIKICCESTKNNLECPPDYWAQSSQHYCEGETVLRQYARPSKLGESSCAIYTCKGQMKVVENKICSAGSIRKVGIDLILDQSFLNDLGKDWKKELQKKIANVNWYYRDLGI